VVHSSNSHLASVYTVAANSTPLTASRRRLPVGTVDHDAATQALLEERPDDAARKQRRVRDTAVHDARVVVEIGVVGTKRVRTRRELLAPNDSTQSVVGTE